MYEYRNQQSNFDSGSMAVCVYMARNTVGAAHRSIINLPKRKEIQ